MFLPISLQLDILCMLNISCIYSYIQSSFVFSYRLSVTFAFDNYHCFILFLYIYVYLLHQRCSSTSITNTFKSFCVPRSWTNNISCRDKRHRKHGTLHIMEEIVIYYTSDFSQPVACCFFLSCRLLVSQQQLLCSIFWWPLSVGCWLKEFISTCLL